jgi:hypothetical protein
MGQAKGDAARAIAVALRGRRGWRGYRIEQIGDGGHKLRGSKRLGQYDAIRDAHRGPFLAVGSGHINNGHRRIGFSGGAGDFPTVKPSDQIDVGHDCPILGIVTEKRNCFLARSRDSRFKTAVGQGLFDHSLNKLVVLDDQNHYLNRVVQSALPMAALLQSPWGSKVTVERLVPVNVQK